jgi:hypothetical protein
MIAYLHTVHHLHTLGPAKYVREGNAICTRVDDRGTQKRPEPILNCQQRILLIKRQKNREIKIFYKDKSLRRASSQFPTIGKQIFRQEEFSCISKNLQTKGGDKARERRVQELIYSPIKSQGAD